MTDRQRRVEQPSTLRTTHRGSGDPSMMNSTPLQRNGDVVPDVRKLVGGPSTSVETLDAACGANSSNNIKKCQSKRCKLCFNFHINDSFVSSSTHRTYDTILPPNTTTLNCSSTNCIYLITCTKCKLQYVGETVQTLRNRFSTHRQGMKDSDKDHMCKRLGDH